MKDKIIIGMFVVVLAIFSITHLFTKDRPFSNIENRFLKSWPDFSWESYFTGAYNNDVELYLLDHVSFREQMVKCETTVLKNANISLQNDVYVGADGYLLENYTEPGSNLGDNVEVVNDFLNRHSGLNVAVAVIPTSSYIYKEKLPKNSIIYNEEKVMDSIENGLDNKDAFIDLVEILSDNKDQYIFFKTDSHWTMTGAYYGYNAICDELGIEAMEDVSYTKTLGSDGFLGDLYSKCPILGQEDDKLTVYTNTDGEYKIDYVDNGTRATSLIVYDNLKIYDKYSAFLDGNHSLVRITSNGANSKSILVIKDSNGNPMIPFICDSYVDVHVIDLRFYHDDIDSYIERNKIDTVVMLYGIDYISEEVDDFSILK